MVSPCVYMYVNTTEIIITTLGRCREKHKDLKIWKLVSSGLNYITIDVLLSITKQEHAKPKIFKHSV